MTDLLLKPEDTGDIPIGAATTDPGMSTQNLAPYAGGLRPALRRPTAVLALVTKPSPPPVPLPPPPPKQDDEIVWSYADPSDNYLGRHRKPSRWDWLTVPLAMGWQRIGRSM